MSEKATIYDLNRMCKSCRDCVKCPLETYECDMAGLSKEHLDEINQKILDWIAHHPAKTRQDIFLEQYPETDKDLQGIVDIAPCVISKKYRDMQEQSEDCGGKTCKDCFREYWLEEIEQ